MAWRIFHHDSIRVKSAHGGEGGSAWRLEKNGILYLFLLHDISPLLLSIARRNMSVWYSISAFCPFRIKFIFQQCTVHCLCIFNSHLNCNVSAFSGYKVLNSVGHPWHFGTDPDADAEFRILGSVPLTDRSGYGRPKNIWTRMRILNSGTFTSFFKDKKS